MKNGTHHNPGLQEAFNANHSLVLHFYPKESREAAVDEEQRLINTTDPDEMFNRVFNARNSAAGMWDLVEYRERLSKARLGNSNAKGIVHTTEHKAMQSEWMKGNKHLIGHTHSEESRRKMSIAHTGRKQSSESIRKSALGRIKGTVTIDGVEYESRSAASRAMNLSDACIRDRCESDKFPNWIYTPKLKS